MYHLRIISIRTRQYLCPRTPAAAGPPDTALARCCGLNLATQANIFRGHQDGISSFCVWGQDVISISRNNIALTSVSRPMEEALQQRISPQKLYSADRGIRNPSALSAISVLPFSRLFLVGTEDGCLKEESNLITLLGVPRGLLWILDSLSTCLHSGDGEAQEEEEEEAPAPAPTHVPTPTPLRQHFQLDQLVEQFNQWELCLDGYIAA
ncbi:hypothetical protein MA16_Dca026700 [Dendrobium catenatum]|uniref:Uncharacterized protein n=1 Tax=Dendrobium catenatum TaxID=906689 RepID=A0A2I0VBZ6_9ASPA|nr:hypothetical protein MA16_Dca026700 [Dendrobium catenatum]